MSVSLPAAGRKPRLITFPELGDAGIGYISVAEKELIPFEIKRAFWTYYTPETIVRGRHAHHRTEQVIIAAAGRIVVFTELPSGEVQTFVLDKPSLGVYVPPYAWHTMQYSPGAVQLVVASTVYDPADYIEDYDEFKQLRNA